MEFVYNDGGRGASGFRGETRDCVTRAIAIAVDRPYREVYDALNSLARHERVGKKKARSSARLGVHRRTFQRYLRQNGWEWVPTMRVGEGCTVHLRPEELPSGRLIVRLSRHLCAVIDGVIHDSHDCSRDGSRCVYGYFRPITK